MSNSLRILRKVRKEFDYKSYIETTLPVKYTSKGELRICCPKCDDQSFKCYVNDDKKYFNCFKCDFNSGNYDVFDFVAFSEGTTRGQAQLILSREYADVAKTWAEIADMAEPFDVGEDEPRSHRLDLPALPSLPEDAVPLTRDKPEEQRPYWDYLTSRGFTDQEVVDIKVHCVPSKHSFVLDKDKKVRGNIGHRVIFPVYGGANKLVSWLGRSIDGTEPKYFNAPDSPLSQTFWPFVPSATGIAFLVEGLIDSLAVRRVGLESYATFGKKITYDQVLLLQKWGVTSVVLFWDKRDAMKEMIRAIEMLKMYFDAVSVPSFKDWPKDKDSGDTLAWEEGASLMKDMLTNKLIDVNSMDFALWKME